MEGQAEVATKNASTGEYLNGTLAYQLSDPRTSALFSPLWNNATKNWTVLDNVKVGVLVDIRRTTRVAQVGRCSQR